MARLDPAQIKSYLYHHIPLSQAMSVDVVRADVDKVVLRAPLAPNINHRDTVFGGSASALAILSAWTLLYVRLQQDGLRSRVVIQRNSMEYLHAIADEFEAHAAVEDVGLWQRFVQMLARRQRARITVRAVLYCHGQKVGEMEGVFVALATV